jgi:hypothetical protein
MKISNDEFFRVSVHEAGHFVFAKIMGLDAIEMALREGPPGIWSGHVKRRLSRLESLLDAEREGRSPETVRERWQMPPAEFAMIQEKMRRARSGLIEKFIAQILAGPAADSELGGGNATMGENDYMQAKAFALGLVPDDQVAHVMTRVMDNARKMAAGALREPILEAAKRLREKRHFDESELNALWSEIAPHPVCQTPDHQEIERVSSGWGTMTPGSPMPRPTC